MFNPRTLLAMATGYGLYYITNTPGGHKLAKRAAQIAMAELGGIEGAVLGMLSGKGPAKPEKEKEDEDGKAQSL